MIGRTIANYRVLEKVGSGASGTVYRAEHLTLGIPVALKFIHRHNLDDPANRARFKHEARAAAILDHTAICKVFDFEESDDDAYIAMDFVEGDTLGSIIAEGPLPLDDAVLMAIQIAEGLEAAHRHDLIHRDIKPSNLMVTNPGNGRIQVKILDFGIARSFDSTRLTKTGGIVGTMSYMSPEQATGRDVDHRTDVWSLGVCLYEMVTGRSPFTGDHDFAVQYALIHSDPVTVGSLRPEAPPELRRIINRAMNKSPQHRYQSATEMLADLRALRREVAEEMSPVQAWLWKYRNRLTLGVGTIFILALLGIILPQVMQQQANPFKLGGTRRVTHLAGWEAEPRISPDGNLVAFTSNAAGNLDIYWVGLAGGDPVRLTDDPADDSEPRWLADGSGIIFTSTRLGQSGIWETDLSGGNTRLLLEEAHNPALSTDGRKIAFTKLDKFGNGRIFAADLADLAEIKQLTGHEEGYWTHSNPVWSPDSDTICYGDYHNLWTVQASGGTARLLTRDGIADGYPAYSPDGRFIYFSSFRDGSSALWRTTNDGKQLLKLTPGSGPESQPDLSRNGNVLAYTTQTGVGDLVITEFPQGESRRLATPTRDIQPTVSPDGTLLAFISTRWNRFADLWLQDLTSGEQPGVPVRLVEQQGTVSHPSISPDNRWVAYYLIRGEDQSRDIWIAPIPAGLPVQITDHEAADFTPVWSPDGRFLAFGSDREGLHAIYTIPISDGRATGPPTRVTSLEMSAIYPTWSPDGSQIAFQAMISGTRETWVIRLDGTAPAVPLTQGATTYMTCWAHGPDLLWASGLWGGQEYEIRMIDPDGGPAVPLDPPLLMGPDNEIPGFSLDRAGRLMVHSVEEMKGDIWVLETEQDNRF